MSKPKDKSHTGFVTVVTAAPPPGYTLRQRLPLEPLRQACVDPNETVRIERRLYRGGKELRHDVSDLELRNGEWIDGAAASYDLSNAIDEADWRSGADVPFLETLIYAAEGRGFRSMFAPSFYTVFDSDRDKSFFNDNALKYANTVVIYQIEAFNSWVEGYPACAIDRSLDAGQSVLLINPHERPAVVSVELEGISDVHKVRIGASSARRVDFAAMLHPERNQWTGQAFVWGTNRVNMFFVSHKLSAPHSITTMEHSEVFRGEHAYVPWLGRVVTRFTRNRARKAKVSDAMG
jgi:hypothetical protein